MNNRYNIVTCKITTVSAIIENKYFAMMFHLHPSKYVKKFAIISPEYLNETNRQKEALLEVLPLWVYQCSSLHLPVLIISNCFCCWTLPCGCSCVVINIVSPSSLICSSLPAEIRHKSSKLVDSFSRLNMLLTIFILEDKQIIWKNKTVSAWQIVRCENWLNKFLDDRCRLKFPCLGRRFVPPDKHGNRNSL